MRRSVLSASILGLALLGSASTALSGSLTQGELRTWCEKDRGFATAYIQGVLESMSMTYSLNPTAKEGKACFPDRITYGRLFDLVCDDVRANPKKDDKDAIMMISVLLEASFPCK